MYTLFKKSVFREPEFLHLPRLLVFVTVLFLLSVSVSIAQSSPKINPHLLHNYWDAQWIAHPSASPFDYGVYHFRKEFEIEKQPESFIIHISGDNRYELFINGQAVSTGPATSDLFAWSFETVDLAPHLQAGKNVIAAKVWNGGDYRPMAWMSHRTGLIVQGDTEEESLVNSNNSWRVFENKGYSPVTFEQNDPQLVWEYYVAGATDSLVAEKYPWGWEEIVFESTSWEEPYEIAPGAPFGKESHQRWHLSPRTVPALTQETKRFARIARVTGDPVSDRFIRENETVILANSKSVVLIDLGELTTGYPRLTMSGGKGSSIKLLYNEALYIENKLAQGQKIKGHRDQTEGKTIFGVYDVYIPDGAENRTFRPLNPRTFRWIELTVETGDEELILEDLSAVETRYPSERNAGFKSSEQDLNDIWSAGWRTQELSVQDTFVSDLYWERMQYIGDTKIQAITWMHMSGDDRLVRLALEQFNRSRAYFGLTQSRYPSWLEQYIPLYSLVWVTMVYDYWMHRPDDDYIEQFLPGIQQVLNWFDQQLNEEGRVGALSHYDFVDSNFFPRRDEVLAESPGTDLVVHSLFYAWTLNQAAELFRYYGREDESLKYNSRAEQLNNNVHDCCFDEERGLFADSPSETYFSMQTNIMAVLAGAVEPERQAGLLRQMLGEPDILPVEMYFEYYLGRALNKAGLGELYINRLDPWTNMLEMGMGTFGEVKENPRSECHAWSASPNYEFIATVAGIEPAEPGFRKVRIKPNLGSLTALETTMPHPLGEISVVYRKSRLNELTAKITLPDGLSGDFEWQGESRSLHSGTQTLNFD